jgi:hypothetical protein
MYVYKVTLMCSSVTVVDVPKARLITYSECVSLVLVIQRKVGLRRIMSVACLSPPYFPTLSLKRKIFREKKLLLIKHVF